MKTFEKGVSLDNYSYDDIKDIYENDNDTQYSFVIENYNYNINAFDLPDNVISMPNEMLAKEITLHAIINDAPIESTTIVSRKNDNVIVKFVTKPVTLRFAIDIIFDFLYGDFGSLDSFYDNYAKNTYIKSVVRK